MILTHCNLIDYTKSKNLSLKQLNKKIIMDSISELKKLKAISTFVFNEVSI